MNLGLFNRMNIKETKTIGMYSQWASLSVDVQNISANNQSVLEKFGIPISKEVTPLIVRQLASNLGITNVAETSPLTTDKEVQWSMEFLCFGLSLPLTEHDTIKDCVNVYCKWLTALLPVPVICVPQPVVDDPNVYARKIVNHLYYLFTSKKEEGSETINQAVLCHRVLRTLKDIAHESKILDRETWESFLIFLLAINDSLLSPPSIKDDLADQLGETTLGVLLEMWLIACAQSFPSPSLWKTLRECCMNWRHRTALIDQWNRINTILTSKILLFMYGTNVMEKKLDQKDAHLANLNNDIVAQSWFRFLNTIGNPVCLTKPEVISQTSKFLQCSIAENVMMDPSQHPCLQVLPNIFCKAMKGIASQVDDFLGLNTSIDTKTNRSLDKPKCNSILHLFGDWLFAAAFIGQEQSLRPARDSFDSKSTLDSRHSLNVNDNQDSNSFLTLEKFESGRAEALGILCRIMCSKITGEEILPVYLARFYMSLQQGLRVRDDCICGEDMVSILLNSSNLFRLDLNGVRMLLPTFINAIEIVLSECELKLYGTDLKTNLRRASINLLLSILVLPLHFQNTIIRELNNSGTDRFITFGQLKLRLMNILINALQSETDPQNTHMLLGGLYLAVQDSALFEKSEQFSQVTTEYNPNLLSSDSAHAFFVRTTYLVCNRLKSFWKTDLGISLAALELLSGLARIEVKGSESVECKRAVKRLCDYIVHQCSKPPPAHSKDLHSTIVAAFHCCSIWLLEHPYLLQDKECLTTVLEVVELGISGTKSVGKPGEPVKLKEEKEIKPASIRVRDAAEHLLTCILEDIIHFPKQNGANPIFQLDEASLLQHCNSWSDSQLPDQECAVKKFKYFVSEGSVMMALLDEPLGNDQDPQPTVTILLRGPFGRHAWTMQLRNLPRHRSSSKYHAPNPGRPVFMQDAPVHQVVKQKYFPDSIDKVMQCKIDHSIPSLESVLSNNPAIKEATAQLEQIFEKQIALESTMGLAEPIFEEYSPPPVCNDFQATRLFLSHFGFLDIDNENGETGLINLNNGTLDFCKDLKQLDNLSPRTCDTVHIFYVKSQQTDVDDILGNVADIKELSPYFVEFVHTLGWIVETTKHAGWTGHVNSKSLSSHLSRQDSNMEYGDKFYDGLEKLIYWADARSEIAFLVPSIISSKSLKHDVSLFNTSNLSSWNDSQFAESEDDRKSSIDSDKPSISKRRYTQRFTQTNNHCKIMVVWLEDYEDYLNLPVDDLLPYMETGLEGRVIPKASDVMIIFIHPLNNGLFRIHLKGPSSKLGLALPLVSGMVINRRSIGALVRQTALNMAKRRRLDCDNYQPPHVRRRVKIQELAQKYKRDMGKPELLTYMFRSC